MSSAVQQKSTESPAPSRKASGVSLPDKEKEKRYKCTYCNRAFSRSEHRSRHERSHTKERPFSCTKCKSTFVRRDLLLRHDRTVHAKDGGVPLQSDGKRRNNSNGTKGSPTGSVARLHEMDEAPLEQFGDGTDMFGVEQAAMLMANLQQHGRPNQDVPSIASDPLISPHAPSMMEPSIPHAGSMMLPQMHGWDQMVPQTVSEPKDPSLSSVPDGHNDLLAYANGNNLSTASNNGLAPLMERQHSNTDSLPPFPPSSIVNDLGTPGALSPFPSILGPVSPVDYRKSPGPSQQCSVAKAPQVASEEQRARIVSAIQQCDGNNELVKAFRLPQLSVLNRFLSSYFNLFHHHMPFLHPTSFDPASVAAPLLLSVLSIGALYTFEQREAYMLHIASKVLVVHFLDKKDNFSSRRCPLWMMQASLLNMSFASWSGDPKGLEWACSIKSLLANMVAGNRYELNLRSEGREGRQPTHEEWIEDEGCRRTYYAVYIFFGLLTLTFNHTPAINFNEFDALELPSSESLWSLEAGDNDSWAEMLTASNVVTFRQAHDALFQGETIRYSAFATRVMINALCLEVWFLKRSPEALQDVVTEYKLRMALDTWEASLAECEPEIIIVQLSAPHKGHPLIFNAMAMYRNTRSRLMVDLKNVQEALRYHNSYEVATAMTLARVHIRRDQEMLNVIQNCFDCIEVAAQQGIRWVARISATNWSIEHPLCGLDLIVTLSLWLWRVEHDDEPATEDELRMYQKLKNLFDEDSVDGMGQKLSAIVPKLWGSMIDEVVVWGITKLMGEAFQLHACSLAGYEDSVNDTEHRADANIDDRPVTEVAAY